MDMEMKQHIKGMRHLLTAGICVGGTLFLWLSAYMLGPVWWSADGPPGRHVKTVENPVILPWWWTSTNVGLSATGRQEYLCVVDVVTGQFFPLGKMDTGRRELSEVAAYKPTASFRWQCPPGTIVEMTTGEIERIQARVRALQEKEVMDHARHQRAQKLTRNGER